MSVRPRRTAKLASCTFFIALAFAGLGTSSAQPADWLHFRGGARLLGLAEGALPQSPKPLWSFDAKKGFTGSPAIGFDGAGRGTLYAGSLDGNLYALDWETGSTRFVYKAQDEIKSSPSVWRGVVYVGDEKGALHAVDAQSGARRWVFQAEGAIASAVNPPEDGKGCLLVSSYDQNVYCLSQKDGTEVWRLATDGNVHATPSLVEGLVVVGGCDGVFRVARAADGKELNSVRLGGYIASSPAVRRAAGGLQAFLGTFENQVVRVDFSPSRAPSIAWSYRHPSKSFPYFSSPALAEGLVVIGGRDKLVHALDAETGSSRWTFPSRAAVDASPVVVKDRVLVADKSGQIAALDLKTGRPVWTYDAGSSIESTPAVANGRFVIATTAGTVLAFGEAPKASPAETPRPKRA